LVVAVQSVPLSVCHMLLLCYKSSAVAEMGDRGHNRHWPKTGGGCSAHFAGKLGTRLTQCGLGRGLLPYQAASSSTQPFGHNRHEPKTLSLIRPSQTSVWCLTISCLCRRMQVAAVCRSCFYQLRVVQRSLTRDVLQPFVQAFVHCRLDYCNAILTGAADG